MPRVSWRRRPIRVDLPSSTLPAADTRSSSFSAVSARNWYSSALALISEVALALLALHAAVRVMVDHAGAALRGARHHHLLDDRLEGGRVGPHRARARDAAEAPEAAADALDALVGTGRVPLARGEGPV